MSSTDIAALLAEIAADNPCGEDLSYDPAYQQLERGIQGTPEQQVGDKIIPAEDPNWREIKGQCVDLLKRSKDLRVAIDLALTLMQLDGLPGLRDGMSLVVGMVEKYWDAFWPRLDPDDDNDPTERMNIVSSLGPESSYQDPLRFPQRLLDVPLVTSTQLGRFSLRHRLVANGELAPAADQPATDQAQIDAAFATAKDDELSANVAALTEIQALFAKLDTILGEKVGPTKVPNLEKFTSRLKQIRTLYDQKAPGGSAPGVEGEAAPMADGQGAPAQAAVARGPGLSGAIGSRDEVMKALDLITTYYRRYEPSSPVPLLMQRARRLVEKDFLEIMKDMSPEGMAQIRTILGVADSAEGQQQ